MQATLLTALSLILSGNPAYRDFGPVNNPVKLWQTGFVSIRPSTTGDLLRLQQLFEIVWPDEPGAVAYHGGGRRPGLLVERDEQIVGYGCVWQSPLHTTYTYLGIHVHPAFRRQGIGAVLWKTLTKDVNSPLKVKTYANQTQTIHFLDHCGLTLSVETHEPVLDTNLITNISIVSLLIELKLLGFEFVSLDSITDPDIVNQVALLHDEVYLQAHRHDPATPGLLDNEDYLGEDLNPNWLWFARKGNAIAGISSIRLTGDLSEGELGWFGTAQSFIDSSDKLVLALTVLAFQAAAKDGIERVNAELDSVDANAMQLLHALPWKMGKLWLTFTSA